MNQDIYVMIEHLRGEVADISYVLLAAGSALAKTTGGRVVGMLLGHQAQGLASNLAADQVLYVEHPALSEFTSDAYSKVLVNLIRENQPRAVLLGSTSIGSDLAGLISAQLALPLVSSCRSFTGDGKAVCQICGGKIMTENVLSDTTTLITLIPGGYKAEEGQSAQSPEIVQRTAPDLSDLRVSLASYIEPEASDVDISREAILIAIGRGIQTQDNIELAEELAEALGGVVCASRPVVDQGWLPTSRLVGKSGKHVKPAVYLAIGISGAPEHAEAITDSGTIIAINTDPTAPIFDLANYGAEADLFDLLPVLTEEVRRARG